MLRWFSSISWHDRLLTLWHIHIIIMATVAYIGTYPYTMATVVNKHGCGWKFWLTWYCKTVILKSKTQGVMPLHYLNPIPSLKCSTLTVRIIYMLSTIGMDPLTRLHVWNCKLQATSLQYCQVTCNMIHRQRKTKELGGSRAVFEVALN